MDRHSDCAEELKQKLDAGEKVLLVDVREPWENQMCAIEGAKLVPLNTIPSNLATLEGAEQIIVYCHHGGRSLNAAACLRKQGMKARVRLPAGSTDGPPKSIPRSRATELVLP